MNELIYGNEIWIQIPLFTVLGDIGEFCFPCKIRAWLPPISIIVASSHRPEVQFLCNCFESEEFGVTGLGNTVKRILRYVRVLFD